MTAADQTPATDSERGERILRVHAYRIVRESVHGITLFGCWGCDWQGDSSSIATHQADMLAVAVVNPLLALLAEQTATIERVRAVRDRARDGSTGGDGMHHAGYWEACDAIADALDDALDTALGSQRTEGQG